MANEQYTSPNMSRSEEIVQATIDGTEYNKPSQSRLETLLIELKEAVEAGSGESSDYATALSLTIDSSTYVITASLLNKDGDTLGTAQTIDLPIESVVVSGSYDAQTKKVILTLQSGSTIEFSVADLVSGLQSEITSSNKLSADLVDDTNTTHKFVTASDKTTWNNKQNVLTVGTNLDDVPIENSTNPITSGGVYNTVGNLDAALDSLIMSLEPKTITANGTYDPTDDGVDGYSEVTVNIGGSASKKDVNFYDYDGTVVASYTSSEFAELTAMPENPTHEGLTAQGWNWTLSDAKTYVASYGKLNIGQMYITSDGKTRLYIELTEGRLQPWLKLYLNANSELDIDWGDGSTHSTFTNTGSSSAYSSEAHTYASAGSYVIAISVVSGGFILQSSSSSISTLLTNNNNSANSPDRGYLNSIKKVEIGSGVTSIGNYVFYNCSSLSSITIPNSVTSIGTYAFQYCSSLSSITIPNSVTSIDTYAFQYCYSLTSITIPNSVTSIGSSVFYNCSSLSSITIPNSVTSIDTYAFQYCSSLSSITIPNSVTSIDTYAFQYCYSLTSITIPNSVTSIGNYVFYNCYSLTSITIPNSVTSIGTYAFQYCSSLSSITIPNSVTSIDSNAFSGCRSLSSITIPNSVTSIGSSVFYNCSSLSSITIPNSVTSIGSNAFGYCYSLATITINKAEGSISGSPWGATTGSPTSTQIVWTG